MPVFNAIFDPDNRLQRLRERLEDAKEGVSQKIHGPVHQAFVETIDHITTRVKSQMEVLAPSEVAAGKKKSYVPNVTSSIDESVTDEEIKLEVDVTARGIATREYGDSQTRPTGVVRQEALSLQVDVVQTLKDVLGEV